jgi:hypothetical protein
MIPEASISTANGLCEQCVSLNLSIEKFVIEDDKAAEIRPSALSLRLANEQFLLGSLAEVRKRAATCSLCSLVASSVGDASVPDDAIGATCNLIWEMDGRMSTDPRRALGEKRTRRLRVHWNNARLKQFDSYLVLAAPAKYDTSDVDYPGQLNDETQFLGRRFGATENKKNLIREFLRLCERHHDRRCTQKLGIEDPFRDTLMEPYFGVIDIENDNLVPLPYEERNERLEFEAYAAVSYVWGGKGSREHKTRIGNIQSRRKSGGLAGVIRKLPRALQQSIRLIHDLGIRYIWIDAICIVQDSSHSWNLNARAMHLIYGNATLTICAADGDSTRGLLALDEDLRPQQQIATYAEGVHLILHQPPEISIQTSQWNKRAWTFQERLLSKRCLIFTRGQIYFQCRSTSMSEDIFADKKGRGWSLDLVEAPLQMLSQLKLQSLWFYANCVYLYTLRELYEPFDILAAFSGMCKLMESTMQAPFVFGLPTSHFDLALLWEPVDRLSPLDKVEASNEPKYKDIKFPSWSWCGWKGDGIQYKPEMVDGCLADARAWLMDHTWIDWHIRDGHGTLRRLWDRHYSGEDKSIDDRWKGYNVLVVSEQDALEAQHETSDNGDEADDEPTIRRLFSDQPALKRTTLGTTLRRRRNSVAANSIPAQKGQRRLDEETARSLYDEYGRPLKGAQLMAIQGMNRLNFSLTLPEDPYHVRKAEPSPLASNAKEFPDQPYLQFFTWRTSFHVVRSDDAGDSVGKARCRCHITDRRGDKCGSIIVRDEWLKRNEDLGQTKFEFIAISEAKSFSKQEFPVWTYYLPKERAESEWDLYFVLLVEPFPEEGIYRRVALGKVFQAAFTLSDDEWKEIILG